MFNIEFHAKIDARYLYGSRAKHPHHLNFELPHAVIWEDF